MNSMNGFLSRPFYILKEKMRMDLRKTGVADLSGRLSTVVVDITGLYRFCFRIPYHVFGAFVRIPGLADAARVDDITQISLQKKGVAFESGAFQVGSVEFDPAQQMGVADKTDVFGHPAHDLPHAVLRNP